jgi:type I restriction enzyme S subunit
MKAFSSRAKANPCTPDMMVVRQGYKRTEVGLIPEDWTATTLGSLGRTLSGGTPRSSDARYWGGDIPWVSSKDMKVARLDDSIDHVTPLALGNGTRLVQPGTILMVVRGMSLAHSFPVAVVECPVAFNQDLKALVPNGAVNGEFILRWLQANAARILLLTTEATHGTKRLPTRDLLGCYVALPGSHEQRAIADALSDVDGLVEALDALIAKKRAGKKAAMQQLLTGTTRLPGFSGKWEKKRLGEHVTFLRTGANSRAELTSEGSVRYLHYGDIHTSSQVRLEPRTVLMPCLPQERGRTLDRLREGDLVFVDASEDLEGVGKSVEIACVADIEVVAGLHTIAARFDETVLAHGFKAYLQFCPAFRGHLRRLAAGTKVYATNRMHIAIAELQLPSADEQSAIATVLSDMDSEITALEHRRDKTRAIRQGMMQQLISGRIRLVETEPACHHGESA